MTVKKLFGYIHLWLGLTSGLVIFIVAFTGAIYVFSADINNYLNKDFTHVKSQNSPILSADSLLEIGNQTLEKKYGKLPEDYWNWQSLIIYSNTEKTVIYEGHRYKNPDVYHRIYINPYTGEVVKANDSYEGKFWQIIIELHTSLMLGDIGVWIVEIATLIFLIMIISGLVLWWPKNKSARKQRFWFRWKENIKWRRKNYDLHNILGFYMCWIVIFMIITGLGWSFDWFNKSVHGVLGGDIERKAIRISNDSTTNSENKALNKIFSKAKLYYPDAYEYSFSTTPYHKDDEPYPKNKPMEVIVNHTESYAYSNLMFFHPQTGDYISQLKYEDKTTAEKYDALSGDIHYGWVFGWPSKILTCLGCLISASLPFTGFYIWYGRRKKTSIKYG